MSWLSANAAARCLEGDGRLDGRFGRGGGFLGRGDWHGVSSLGWAGATSICHKSRHDRLVALAPLCRSGRRPSERFHPSWEKSLVPTCGVVRDLSANWRTARRTLNWEIITIDVRSPLGAAPHWARRCGRPVGELNRQSMRGRQIRFFKCWCPSRSRNVDPMISPWCIATGEGDGLSEEATGAGPNRPRAYFKDAIGKSDGQRKECEREGKTDKGEGRRPKHRWRMRQRQGAERRPAGLGTASADALGKSCPARKRMPAPGDAAPATAGDEELKPFLGNP